MRDSAGRACDIGAGTAPGPARRAGASSRRPDLYARFLRLDRDRAHASPGPVHDRLRGATRPRTRAGRERGAGPARGAAAPTAAPPPRPRRHWGRLPEVAVATAIGLLLVALADTAGRHDVSGGAALFWIGTGCIFAPVALRLLLCGSILGRREPAGLAVVVAVTSFLTKLCYSPLSFTFPDELQHWRARRTCCDPPPVHAEPRAADQPALSRAGDRHVRGVSITGLGIFAAGVAVTAAAHLVLATALYCIFARLSGSARVAALGVLAYATNAHFSSFDAMFLYQALGLAFLALTLLADVEAVREPAPRRLDHGRRDRPWCHRRHPPRDQLPAGGRAADRARLLAAAARRETGGPCASPGGSPPGARRPSAAGSPCGASDGRTTCRPDQRVCSTVPGGSCSACRRPAGGKPAPAGR